MHPNTCPMGFVLDVTRGDRRKFVLLLHSALAKSLRLQDMMLEALKFAVSPKGVLVSGKPRFRQRKGGLYWRRTKNNMCIDIGSPSLKTYLLNTSCAFIENGN